jgi:hypothetical protein
MARQRRTTKAPAPTTKSAKKPVAKKPVAKKPVAKKPAAKKPAAKKPARIVVPKPSRSAAPAIVTVDGLFAAVAKLAPQLRADPMFRHSSNAPFDIDELEGHFAKAGTDLGQLFADTLQGMIQSVRYAAIQVVRELFASKAKTTRPGFKLAQGDTLAVVGDLTVNGDLENDGVLVVTGNLTVKGAYIGPAFDYSLAAVGGIMRARDVSSSGEIIVGRHLEATRLVHLLYNDYSSVLPTVKARALVIEDNFPALGTIVAPLQLNELPSDDQLREIFGAAAVDGLADDNENPIRTLIRS